MKTIAVFGGTFNPFHNGHMQMLKALTASDRIDKTLLIPSKIPPHKKVDFLAADEHRLNMCRLAAEVVKDAEVCDIELKRSGKSYTVDTLCELAAVYPNDRLALAVGGDMLTSFTSWRNYSDILKKAGLIAFRRADTDNRSFDCAVESLINEGADITVMDERITDISSTVIRESINDIDLLKKYLPENILKYIIQNKVYGDIIGI